VNFYWSGGNKAEVESTVVDGLVIANEIALPAPAQLI
jgi:hypothetical protein